MMFNPQCGEQLQTETSQWAKWLSDPAPPLSLSPFRMELLWLLWVEYLTTKCNSTCLKHFITDFRLYSFMPLSWSRCWHCLTIMAKYQNSILLWYRLESIKNCTKDGTECLVWFVVLFTNSLIKHVYILQGIKKLRLEKNSWALKLNTRTLHTAMIHFTFDYISTYISL